MAKYDKADEILKNTIDILEKTKFLDIFWTNRPSYKLYQLKEGKILFNFTDKDQVQSCPKCHRVFNFKTYKSCTNINCPPLESVKLDDSHFYLNLYKQYPNKESEVNAKEHSSQIEGSLREKFENDFQDTSLGSINVLVCTPTMELGIDIGELSAIIMRNVPPDPSRYAQRAGRAGRKNQPSIVLVYCGTGQAKGPHDQYFYKDPEKIVSGKITPPNFLLDNKKLIKKHIHSALLETLQIKIPNKIKEILDLEKEKEGFPFHHIFKDSLNTINSNSQSLKESVNCIFSKEIEKFNWFKDDYIHSTISSFSNDLDNILNYFRENYSEISSELNYLHKKSLSRGIGSKDNREYSALSRKLSDMREGNRPYDSFNVLKTYGFLPNYAFPSSSTLLTMYNHNRMEYHDNWRSEVIAINEFAPFNQVYFLGNKYNVKKAMIKTDRGEIKTNYLYICEFCNEILIDSKTSTSISLVKCPYCQEEIQLSNFKASIAFPHMYSISGPRITCDEEIRRIKGYEVTMNYKHRIPKVEHLDIIKNDIIIGTISYEHNGKIYMVNKGSLSRSKASNEIKLNPFNFCSACGQWLLEKQAEKHIEECPKGGSQRTLHGKLWLFIEGNHDVVVFNFPLLEGSDPTVYYTTLKEAIIQSITITYNLDESELNGFVNPIPGESNKSIVIFETEEGGTGVLKSLKDTSTIQYENFIGNVFKILHVESFVPYEESMDACVSACYNCLLRFRNQYDHKHMDRRSILPLIKELKGTTILKKTFDSDEDQNEKFEELKSKCDSQLEIKVLEEIKKLNLPLPDEAQKTFYENGIPVAKADFYYDPSFYIFVDGPVHKEKSVKVSEVEKREKIESKGYTVVVLDFKSGNYVIDPSLLKNEVAKLKYYLD